MSEADHHIFKEGEQAFDVTEIIYMERKVLVRNHLPLSEYFRQLDSEVGELTITAFTKVNRFNVLIGSGFSRPKIIITDGEIKGELKSVWGPLVEDNSYVVWIGEEKSDENDPSNYYLQTTLGVPELRKVLKRAGAKSLNLKCRYWHQIDYNLGK